RRAPRSAQDALYALGRRRRAGRSAPGSAPATSGAVHPGRSVPVAGPAAPDAPAVSGSSAEQGKGRRRDRCRDRNGPHDRDSDRGCAHLSVTEVVTPSPSTDRRRATSGLRGWPFESPAGIGTEGGTRKRPKGAARMKAGEPVPYVVPSAGE